MTFFSIRPIIVRTQSWYTGGAQNNDFGAEVNLIFVCGGGYHDQAACLFPVTEFGK